MNNLDKIILESEEILAKIVYENTIENLVEKKLTQNDIDHIYDKVSPFFSKIKEKNSEMTELQRFKLLNIFVLLYAQIQLPKYLEAMRSALNLMSEILFSEYNSDNALIYAKAILAYANFASQNDFFYYNFYMTFLNQLYKLSLLKNLSEEDKKIISGVSYKLTKLKIITD